MVEKSLGIEGGNCDVAWPSYLKGGEVVQTEAGLIAEETRKNLCGELIVSALFSLAESSSQGELRRDGSKPYFLVKSGLKCTRAELKDALSRAGGLKDCMEVVREVRDSNLVEDKSDSYCVLRRGGGQFSCVLQLTCKGGEVGVVEVIGYSFETRGYGIYSCVLYRLRRALSEVGGTDPVLNMVRKLMPDLKVDDTVHQSIGRPIKGRRKV